MPLPVPRHGRLQSRSALARSPRWGHRTRLLLPHWVCVRDDWAAAEDAAAVRQTRVDAGGAAVALAGGGGGGAAAEAWLEDRPGLPCVQEVWEEALLLVRCWHCWGCAWGDVAAALHR